MSELEELRGALDMQREGVLKKLAGLSETDARRSTVDTGTNVAGLVQHLTFVESFWFDEIVAGGKQTRGDRSMTVDPSVTLKRLRAEYRDACAASDAIIERLNDCDTPVTRNKKQLTLRAVIIHVIAETARHAGHADIIREQVDGKTGR